MELDLRYKQYELQKQENSIQEKVNEDATKTTRQQIKPYQEIIDYLEKNITKLSYKEINSLMLSIQNNINFSLDDGTQVVIGKVNGIINLAINYKDNSKFIASWTNITDEKEYFETLKELK